MWSIINYSDLGRIDIDFEQLISDLEREIERNYMDIGGRRDSKGIVLVAYSTNGQYDAENSIKELELLTKSANKVILDKFIQTGRKIDPKYFIGKGKLREINLRARHIGADTLVFNRELTPGQVRSINKETNLEIVDRTQIILEIFASRATTSEGKLQVQLAQARYALPRLVGKGIELSQLDGGIGTRGPGEKKLEEQRRTLRKQIDTLEKKIDELSRRRSHTRKQRMSHRISTATFMGYTNAGKSTLFNTLTKSNVLVENKLFSTLNPTTRKLTLPSGKQMLVTDTVGFISQLPKELLNAWMNSPAHKENILNNNFTEIGIGISQGLYNDRETTFIVQFFGTPIAVNSIPTPTQETEVVNEDTVEATETNMFATNQTVQGVSEIRTSTFNKIVSSPRTTTVNIYTTLFTIISL
ncbi:MAG: GTPase HflX, partial [Nanoarchaeota archaeon]|nr:GTPase HflX [Nanoarchaeota archaeon]